MASPTASRDAAAPAEQQLLPDHILEDIFLLLDNGPDLARAASTCRAFRRVATGHRFLRRFTSVHPPPLVGVVVNEPGIGHYLGEPPHGREPAMRAIAEAGDFTFSFLPNGSIPNSSWSVRDLRDGRFLLAWQGTAESNFLELVVCDPLYRRYVQIPPIPGDLVPPMPSDVKMKPEPFLAPAGEGEETEEDQHFRVIYNLVSTSKILSFVFSAATGEWSGVTSFSFSPEKMIYIPRRMVRYYACSCFYWVHPKESYMIMLDPRGMEFSLVELKHYMNRCMRDISFMRELVVMEVEGRLALLALGSRMIDIYSRTCQGNGVGAEEWQHEMNIPLPNPHDYIYSLYGAAGDYLLLGGIAPYNEKRVQKVQCFAGNLKTAVIERLCKMYGPIFHGHPYASFPPPLSLPRL